MNGIAAVGLGMGMGLAYFGGLWLTVRHLAGRRARSPLVSYGAGIRMALLGSGLALLGRLGAGALVGALVGIWLSRWVLFAWVAGGGDGR